MIVKPLSISTSCETGEMYYTEGVLSDQIGIALALSHKDISNPSPLDQARLAVAGSVGPVASCSNAFTPR
jgi:hypothetical protein